MIATRITLLTLALVAAASAAAAVPRDAGVLALPGLIVDEAPPDAAARATEPALAGVRRTGVLDAAAAARLSELEAARDAAARVAPGAAFSPLPPLSGDAAAPARIDSGDPDPDRLLDPPAAPAP